LIGPPLSGLLIGLAQTRIAGAALAYLIDSITYLVSALTLCFMRVPFQSAREAQVQHHLWHDILEGLHLLWQQPLLRLLVLLTATVNFLMAPLTLSIIAKATALHTTPAVIGLIFGIAGVGGILGGVIAPWIRRHVRFGSIMIGSVLLWAVACGTLALASAVPVLAAGAVLIDLLWPIYSVVLVTYRLSLVPDHLQGRLNSSFRFVSYGCEALGTASGGLLLGSFGETSSLWLICAGLILCVLVSWSTRLRTA
jgi:predicted MFS family arabinose efflux permease